MTCKCQANLSPLQGDPVSAGCENEDLRHSYRLTLLEMKVHHELVRIVVDMLGHVPEVPLDSGLH